MKTPETSDVPTSRAEGLRQFDREALRSDFLGVFWAAIQKRKRDEKFTMQKLADALGRDKTTVSRWFGGTPNNWETDTIADIAGALDLELIVRARDRKTGTVFSSSGIQVEIASEGCSTPPKTIASSRRGGPSSGVQCNVA